MKYRCSYLIYSEAFDALPPVAKALVYSLMWEVLSGEGADPRYAAVSAVERRAIVEILRDTKEGLPRYFLEPHVAIGGP